MWALEPVAEAQAIPGRILELPGGGDSRVMALAVLPESSPRVAEWVMKFSDSSSLYRVFARNTHAADEGSARSRSLAYYAALHLEGVEPEEWVVSQGFGSLPEGVTVEALPCSNTSTGVEDLTCVRAEVRAELFPGGRAESRPYDIQIVSPGDWDPVLIDDTPPVSPSLFDWTGGSSGLAYALAYLDSNTEGDLVPDGMLVAATGGLAARPYRSTVVTSVSNVEQKVWGAAMSGATVVFVPAGQSPMDPPVPVVEVDTFEDAVWWLCSHGATADIC